MNQALLERDGARREYLEQRVLYAALVEVYSEESAEGADERHGGAGLAQPYDSQNAIVAYLRSALDPMLAAAPATSPTTHLAASMQSPPCQGLSGRLEQSAQHLLGVTPGCLQHAAGAAGEESKACQMRVQQRVMDAVASSAATVRTFIHLSLAADGANADTDAVTRVREELRRVQESEAAISRLLLSTATTRANLAKEHVRVTGDLLSMVQFKTTKQHPLDVRRCRLVLATAAMLRCKEEAVEQQIRAATYTPDTVRSLQQIRKHLLARKAEVRLARDQARVRLQQLKSNPEFLAVARDYNRTKEEMERLSGAFSRLQHHESAAAHRASDF
ncbi:hypothetical protein CLOP_g2812 [Closterium sp. NIES-67]|nr:hypothetical protein CLOP_g2812 [Closterium sp. NIES-67]